jgi:small subunit ribosomal protein S6
MVYELVTLLHPDLEIDLDAPLTKITKQIEGLGGTITKTDNWGKRKLAYPIRKSEFAIYVYFEMEMPPERVAKLDKLLNITNEVLRHLISKYVAPPVPEEKKEKKPKTTESDEASSEEKTA